MPLHTSGTKNAKSPKIRRTHSGCKACRRRGKRCDETKPSCQACTRLSLECSYAVEFSFRNTTGALIQECRAARRGSSRSATIPTACALNDVSDEKHSNEMLNAIGSLSNLGIPASLRTEENLEISYVSHFQSHVRHLLPAVSPHMIDSSLGFPGLRFALLCISASNLSMLNSRVQSRILLDNSRRSVFSPCVNNLHHAYAQKYHNLALWYCRAAHSDEVRLQAPAFLTAYVLLAYYHHASTNHLRFRKAVGDAVRFVLQNRAYIVDSREGADSLQMWYRLCTSHRPAKPPALLLEGEGPSSFGPNLLPDITEHLYLNCIIGMSADDLIYDILIKTLEIRTKLVVFRCVSGTCRVPERSNEIGSLTHEILNKMLGRKCGPDEYAEARESFVRGSHLLGLMEVQRERLGVWRSRLNADQLPIHLTYNPYVQGVPSSHVSSFSFASSTPAGRRFPTHRDAMNALYYMLCVMMFEETNQTLPPKGESSVVHEDIATLMDNAAHTVCEIAGTLNLAVSNTSDRSDALFHYILDILWPQIESYGRGYEHSHYPTHLVKRIIAQIAAYWEKDQVILFALPAVAEDIPKLKLLDIDHPVNLVVCGYDKDGTHFLEKVPLP
ncbi:Zn(II)2Cys6 transcription factor domain-containing protein [Aspergillus alliaceus]|uniref:Zn(II)2Cys6 transcription factor domain-containing protein n=1 Tax=Petromyces alliaceus TaxID=209559 RepID=UPI0012A55D23|nr:uncharacterized protein BDW43DRAFT_323662 [Aspergillus alliaceus]KAB8236555.1 hypothetical protein BDW43DRAFT_323662 [Aspergillus alliaceus]